MHIVFIIFLQEPSYLHFHKINFKILLRIPFSPKTFSPRRKIQLQLTINFLHLSFILQQIRSILNASCYMKT